MRRWVGILAVAVALVGLGLGALAVLLPRLVESEAVRVRIQRAAEEALGEPVAWEALSFGLIPPRLVARQARIGPAASPDVTVERVDLRIALLPLIARAVVVDSLEVQGPEIRLVRDADGIGLPGARKATGTPRAASPARPAEPAAAGTRRVELAVRRLVLEGARIVLEDRSVKPPVTWALSDLEARASGRSLEEPVGVRLHGRLESGGSLRVEGEVRLDGWVDLEAELRGIALAPAAAYVPPGVPELRGLASGTLRWRGPAAGPERAEARLALADTALASGDARLEGTLRLEADLEGGMAAPAVRFVVDASDAGIQAGSFFRKPVKRPAQLAGRAVRQADGSWAVGGLQLRLEDLDAQGSARVGQEVRVALDAPPIEIERWRDLVPPLGPLDARGRVDLREVAVTLAPFALEGGVALEAVQLAPEGAGPFVVDGLLEGAGTRLRSQALRVRVADQPLEVDAEVTGLPAAPRLHATARASAVDTNAILGAVSSMRDTLYGPLTLSADLQAPLAGDRPLAAALEGPMRIEIGNGRLAGVSLLRATFSRLADLAEAAALVGALRGKDLERYYGDAFEAVSGTFDLARGFARTEDLRLDYRDYRVDLRGAIGLLDQSLDLRGTLTLQKALDAALGQAVTGGAEATPADAAPEPQVRVIPLAHVVGTLQRPRVDISGPALAALVRAYVLESRRTRVEQRIDEKLGTGAGKEILDALGGLLGGAPERSR